MCHQQHLLPSVYFQFHLLIWFPFLIFIVSHVWTFLSKFLGVESFFFLALSSQTLFLIKQINIWSKGASARKEHSQLGDLWDQLSWIQLEILGERDSLSSDKIFLTLWNKSSAGKYNLNLTSFGGGKCTAMTNFMTISFFLLDDSVRILFSEGTCEKLRSCSQWSVEITGHVIFFPFFCFFFFWSQSRERRQAMKGEVSNEVILHTCKHTL